VAEHPESAERATDRRTVRTVAAIEAAVREALREVALDELTVAEVCRRAGVGRPSFYTHFASIPAVVAQMLTAEIDDELPIHDLGAVDSDGIEPAIMLNFAAALHLVARDRDLYRAAFASTSSGVLRRVLEKAIETRVRNIILIWLERGLVEHVDMEVAVPFAAGGIANALEAWAFDDATDAADRARAIRDQMPRWWPFPG
jgi:AcrR family transcriptional regulator